MAQALEHHPGYAVLRLSGEPSFHDLVAVVDELAATSRSWPHDRLLVDLTGVNTVRTFTDQFSLGVAVAAKLRHLRIASVVPADRLTRTTEKSASHGGAALRVFTSEAEALAWLLA